MQKLSELHCDVLTEAFNLGMGQAAAALSQMVEEEVVLSVPELNFLSTQKAASLLNGKALSSLSGVSQAFNGSFNGHAMLLFPEDKSLSLVRLLLQDTAPLDNLTEFEEEALNEIGNIILNAGISALADMFHEDIHTDLPFFKQGRANDILNVTTSNGQDTVLFLRVDFKLERHAIDGYVIFLLSTPSIENLYQQIDNYLTALTG